jgi:hypothetical protein
MNVALLATICTSAFARFNMTVIPSDYEPTKPLCDNSTYGNVDEIATSHYHVDWQVDFTSSIITGSVIHDLVAMVDDVLYLQLDVWNIQVNAVYKVDTGAATYVGD